MRFSITPGMRMPAQYVNSLALVANTHERQALPEGYQIIVVNSTANIYVKLGNVSVEAAVPGDVSDGTASELNPVSYVIHNDYTHISIISTSNCVVTLSYYPLV